MAYKTDKRLYKVNVEKNLYFTGVEASSAEEACEEARKEFNVKQVVDCTSEPIYEASIGIDIDAEGASENGVFEITIKGTDEKLVDRLKKALGYLIPGPHQFDEAEWDESLCGSTYPLKQFIDDVSPEVKSF